MILQRYLDFDMLDSSVQIQPPQERKVIFLDVDGVLHDYTADNAIQKQRVSRLQQIVSATGAEIVLTSSWRIFFPEFQELYQLNAYPGYESQNIQQLKTCFSDYDLTISSYTPFSKILDWKNARPLEIRAWLTEQAYVKRFVILDDEDFNWEWLSAFCVQTVQKDENGTQHFGMEDCHVQQAVSILNFSE